jgi:UDP-glucose 4-epimerase
MSPPPPGWRPPPPTCPSRPDARFDIGHGYLPDWDRQVQFDLTRSTRDLGYLPAWELEKGLQSQIEWIRSTEQL